MDRQLRALLIDGTRRTRTRTDYRPSLSLFPQPHPLISFTMPATEDVSRNHVICDSLMSGCSAAEILRLMRTSKAFEVMARDFLRRAYNVHKPLRRFFQDPIAFRLMQYETGTVVSGSFALQFFVRSYYPTADLDLYVTHSGAEKVGSWLQGNGYTYVPAIKKRRGKVLKQPRSFKDAISSLDLAWVPDEFYCKGVMGVLNFEGVVGGNRRKVQLIMTDLCPIRTILNFYSSKSPVLRQYKSDLFRV